MARHAPGLSPSELERMTPEETRRVHERVVEEVKLDNRFHLELAVGVMRASGARISL
jgi:hypothetical protein